MSVGCPKSMIDMRWMPRAMAAILVTGLPCVAVAEEPRIRQLETGSYEVEVDLSELAI